MSKRRALFLLFLCAAWALLVLPLWVIGLGFEAGGFRLPAIGQDRTADILIFYLPVFAAAALLVRPIANRIRS